MIRGGRGRLLLAAGAVAAGGAVLVWWHVALAGYAFDDAYIHFRVASHVVDHGRPYFNLDQPVLASSSPLWTMLVAGVFALAGRRPVAVSVLDALLLAAGAVLWARLVRRWGAGRLAAITFAAVFVALTHHASIGAMETPLALLLVAAGALAWHAGRPWAFVLLALAPFVRAETVVLLAAFLVLETRRRRQAPWGALVACTLVAVPLLLAELAWFGTVIPHPVHAKSLVYQVEAADTLRLLRQDTAALLPLGGSAAGLVLWGAALAGLTGAAAATTRRAGWRPTAAPWAMVAAGVAIFAAYVAAAGLIFPWYVPLFAVPVHAGLWALALRGGRQPLRLAAAGVLGVSLLVGLARTGVAAAGPRQLYPWFDENARVRRYLAIGEQLGRRWPGATLMSSEIGALGWAFEGPVVDAAGLVSPEALEYHPMAVGRERRFGYVGAIPPGLVAEVRPELIVSMDTFAEALLRSGPAQDYEIRREPIYLAEDLERAGDAVLWGTRWIRVLVRRDLLDRRRPPVGDRP